MYFSFNSLYQNSSGSNIYIHKSRVPQQELSPGARNLLRNSVHFHRREHLN
uniref:Uncharacterized protein n=1 Tax=Anguilla anguilla TaxID=7936 RepID=A0A0E9VZN5_ANGAN